LTTIHDDDDEDDDDVDCREEANKKNLEKN
jgi:hypothetical protein